MKLYELLKGLSYDIIQGTLDKEIINISWDSRRVKTDSLFICVKNRNVDRHDFSLAAVKQGAIALVIEHEVKCIPEDITVIRVQNSRMAMSIIANTYYEEPSKKFNLIGITGTNGKTSVTYYISKILESVDRRTGIIGTIENSMGGRKLNTEKLNPTTPDSIELQESLSEMLKEGVTDVAMEVTSSALEQGRVYGCNFDIGVFTNLTQDHLDEHGSMENYKNAKMKLFNMCKKGIVNADDPISKEIKEKASCNALTYSIENDADIMAFDIKHSLQGVSFSINCLGLIKKVHLKVPGIFSVYNALAAIGVCYLSGLALDEIVLGLSKIEGVPGRFDVVKNDKDILVIVDYAHTPDSLKNILSSVKEISKGNIISVFGCGGNRDNTKRPIMGEIAGRLSDFCTITSDNPRSENPMSIIEEIEVGVLKTSCPYAKIENRKDAIFTALGKAQVGDAVIIAGKGHETYQILGNKTIHFDDKEAAAEYFKNSLIPTYKY